MSFACLTDLWHETCEELIFGTPHDSEVQAVGQHVMLFDQQLRADTMEYEFDVSRELWMTKGRFTTLQNDYIEPEWFKAFVIAGKKVNEGKRASLAQMLCRPKGKRHVSYSWGNCILAFTYRRQPVQTFVMHSRISSVTRMGGLDLALAYLVLKEIADPLETRFIWNVDCLFHSPLVGMPYVYAHGLHEHVPDWDSIGARKTYREMQYFDRLDAEGRVGKHGTRLRVRKQRRAYINGELDRPKLPIGFLNLNAIKEQW